MGEKRSVNLACDFDSHVNRRVLLHAANMGHGTDDFTSPPNEGMLWTERPLLVKDGIMGEKWPVNLACDSDFHVNSKVILHAADILWIFSPEKSDGFEPAILGTKGQHANH
jgi:hypothetical protein